MSLYIHIIIKYSDKSDIKTTITVSETYIFEKNLSQIMIVEYVCLQRHIILLWYRNNIIIDKGKYTSIEHI